MPVILFPAALNFRALVGLHIGVTHIPCLPAARVCSTNYADPLSVSNDCWDNQRKSHLANVAVNTAADNCDGATGVLSSAS